MATQTTELAQHIQAAMDREGIGIRELAARVGGTYENIRKIVRGASVPSSYLLRALCQALNLEFEPLQKIAMRDKIKLKYGTVQLEMSGKKPSLDPLDRVWDLLKPEQQQAFIRMAQKWARENSAAQSL